MSDDFLIKQLPHLGVRSKFPVSPGVMWILDSANAQLSKGFLFWNSFSPTTKARTMNWADLVATKSHRFFLFGFEVYCFRFRAPSGGGSWQIDSDPWRLAVMAQLLPDLAIANGTGAFWVF